MTTENYGNEHVAQKTQEEVEEYHGAFRKMQTKPVGHQPGFELPTDFKKRDPRPDGNTLPRQHSDKEVPNKWGRPHKARWIVDEAPLPPEDYPLEPYGTCVANGDSLTVAYRIDECLCKMSVAAEFDVELAEARCKTADQMTYIVRLYQGPKPDTTLVEVARWDDCGVRFREERQRIFDTAKGYGLQDRKVPAPMQMPVFEIKGLEDLYVPLSDDELKQMLDEAVKQLHETRQDSQLFVMSNLASMTDAKVTHSETAVRVAKMILGDAELGLRDLIANLLSLDCPEPRDTLGQKIRNASLKVLFNSIDLVSKDSANMKGDNVLQSLISEEHHFFSNVLVNSLRKDIEGHETSCPHNACLASKCLTGLLSSCNKLRDDVLSAEQMKNNPRTLRAILDEARNFGVRCHCNLEHETERTIKLLNSPVS